MPRHLWDKKMEDMKPNQMLVEAHYNHQQFLPMWTIYRPTTKDYPGQWIARMFLTIPKNKPTDIMAFGSTLEEVRAKLPPNLVKILRLKNDDPVIEEVWL